MSCIDCPILHNILKTTLEFTNTIQNCSANCEKIVCYVAESRGTLLVRADTPQTQVL